MNQTTNSTEVKTSPILASSKSTFDWYLDNLVRIGFYHISQDDYKTLHDSLESIKNILDKLEVVEEVDYDKFNMTAEEKLAETL